MSAIVNTPTRRVTIMKDSLHSYPELWMEVYVAGDKSEQAQFAELLVRGSCTKADSPEKADLVIFTGGPDVNPIYYDETPHPTTHFNSRRDEEDMKLYEICLDQGIPMLGICRGAQFLHVMNGGKLFQDIDGHMGDHNIWDKKAQRIIHGVSSVHHQSCMPNRSGGMEIIAEFNRSTKRWINDKDYSTGQLPDIEAFFYRDTCCLGIQGHPEYRGYNSFGKWSMEKLYEYIVVNPDIELRDRVRRIKLDVLAERAERWKKEIDKLDDDIPFDTPTTVKNTTEETVH